MLPLNLLLSQKNVQRATIARLDDNGYAGWLLAAPARLFLIAQIRNQVVGTALIPDQAIYITGLANECRPNLSPRSTLVPDNALDMPTFKQFLSPGSD
jgi:hypothetical protein